MRTLRGGAAGATTGLPWRGLGLPGPGPVGQVACVAFLPLQGRMLVYFCSFSFVYNLTRLILYIRSGRARPGPITRLHETRLLGRGETGPRLAAKLPTPGYGPAEGKKRDGLIRVLMTSGSTWHSHAGTVERPNWPPIQESDRPLERMWHNS